MSLALYMDVHIDLAITKELRRRGVDVLRAQDDGAGTMDDPDLLDRATALGRVVFTQDHHFLAEAHLRQRNGVPFAGVVFGRTKNVPVGRLVHDLELIAKASDPSDLADTVTYIPFP